MSGGDMILFSLVVAAWVLGCGVIASAAVWLTYDLTGFDIVKWIAGDEQ